MSLSLADLGAIGEFVGSIVVLITLVYLAYQLKQNTRALKSSTWQSIQDAEQRLDISLSEHPENLELFLRGGEGLNQLRDEVELKRYEILVKQLIDLFQTHHYQHEIGIIDAELWQTWVAQFKEDIQIKGIGEIVDLRYHMLRPSFQKFVDEHRLPDS